MGYNFGGYNQTIANSAAALAEINRQQEETMQSLAKAAQERIKREETMVAGAEANIAQKELLCQQVEIIQKQNDLLTDNYVKLKEMYDAQVEANQGAKDELRRSRRFNIAMMVISIVAMLAAIAGPIVTIVVSK